MLPTPVWLNLKLAKETRGAGGAGTRMRTSGPPCTAVVPSSSAGSPATPQLTLPSVNLIEWMGSTWKPWKMMRLNRVSMEVLTRVMVVVFRQPVIRGVCVTCTGKLCGVWATKLSLVKACMSNATKVTL